MYFFLFSEPGNQFSDGRMADQEKLGYKEKRSIILETELIRWTDRDGFFKFFFFLEVKTSATDVFSSCLFIPAHISRQVQ